MKMYSIAEGTTGKLVTIIDGESTLTDWTTTKGLMFTETITDPVAYHNNRGGSGIPPVLNRLAEQGYAMFGGELGSCASAKFILAVPYDQIQVM